MLWDSLNCAINCKISWIENISVVLQMPSLTVGQEAGNKLMGWLGAGEESRHLPWRLMA